MVSQPIPTASPWCGNWLHACNTCPYTATYENLWVRPVQAQRTAGLGNNLYRIGELYIVDTAIISFAMSAHNWRIESVLWVVGLLKSFLGVVQPYVMYRYDVEQEVHACVVVWCDAMHLCRGCHCLLQNCQGWVEQLCQLRNAIEPAHPADCSRCPTPSPQTCSLNDSRAIYTYYNININLLY